MSFRLPSSLCFTAPLRTPPPWTCGRCISRTAASSSFHSSARCRSDGHVDHYAALQLPQSASAGEIKRQFYHLSKKHHPDRNPNDPTASTRFVAISEAYHTLSVPEKRAQYDAHITQSKASQWGHAAAGDHPQGSYSSAGFAGSRPASGLNKRRGTFRGPPPSFYKAGGYGKHGAKRAEHAHYQHAGPAGSEKHTGTESYGGFAGFGPGQRKQGHEVPHFDDRRHKETLDQVDQHIRSRRRRARGDISEEIDRSSMLVNFAIVAGVVGIIGLTARVFSDRDENRKR